MRPILPLSLAALVLAAGAPSAVAAGPTCDVPRDSNAVELDDFYFDRYVLNGVPYVEIWRETNDVGGLQVMRHTCADGTFAPADTLVARLGGSLGGQMIPI